MNEVSESIMAADHVAVASASERVACLGGCGCVACQARGFRRLNGLTKPSNACCTEFSIGKVEVQAK